MIEDGEEVPEQFRRLIDHAASVVDAFGAPTRGFDPSRFVLLVRDGDPPQVEPRDLAEYIGERISVGEVARADQLTAPCGGIWCVAIAEGQAVSVALRFNYAAPGGDA